MSVKSTAESHGGEPGSSGQEMPTIKPITNAIGAWVNGLDVRAELSPAVQETLIRWLHEHGVLFARYEGEIGHEEHVRFSRIFGEPQPRASGATEIPFVSVVDNAVMANAGTERWHSDATVLAEPPSVAVLRATVVPEIGGDTLWASMYAAYEALSSKWQRFLEGLEAVHTSETLLAARPAGRGRLYQEEKSAVHPVVIRDHITGKPALFVHSNYVSQIVGFTEQESASVLRMLFEHVNTAEFHVRHSWDTQTIAIWEERITQHRGVSDYNGHRVLHRVWVKGGAPTAYGEIIR
jgi:taurine dioxygenase